MKSPKLQDQIHSIKLPDASCCQPSLLPVAMFGVTYFNQDDSEGCPKLSSLPTPSPSSPFAYPSFLDIFCLSWPWAFVLPLLKNNKVSPKLNMSIHFVASFFRILTFILFFINRVFKGFCGSSWKISLVSTKWVKSNRQIRKNKDRNTTGTRVGPGFHNQTLAVQI